MNLAAYHVCFSELEKSASTASEVGGWAARGLARAGRSIGRFGKDTARLSVDTFRPSAWKEGVNAWRSERPGPGLLSRIGHRANQVALPTLVGADAVHTMRTDRDPITKRHMGLAERSAVTASHVGSNLAGYKLMMSGGGWKGFGRGMGVMMGAQSISDRAAHLVGGKADKLVHPTLAAGAPVAREVT